MSHGSIAVGPRSRDQFNRLGMVWKQGDHAIITGGTGSGKTTVGRHILDERIRRGGDVVVFLGKNLPDETIAREYKGFTRWTSWHRTRKAWEDKILLWPNTSKIKDIPSKKKHKKEVFEDALNKLMNLGHWTVDIDEGLSMVSPTELNLASHISTLSQEGRSGRLTLIVKAQRPSHLPLVLYSNASQVFCAQTGLPQDQKRIAELDTGGKYKEIVSQIANLKEHEFLWLPIRNRGEPEVINLNL